MLSGMMMDAKKRAHRESTIMLNDSEIGGYGDRY